MRNASKNTIKRIMRKAIFDQTKKGMHFFHFGLDLSDYNPNAYEWYFLFNEIGAQIYRMSKGKICNRGLIGVEKYCKTI